jgi:indoleamine 2,3-dioxygenase
MLADRSNAANETVLTRGFLPSADPATAFPAASELTVLDEWGRDLASWLEDPGFRQRARELRIPAFPAMSLQSAPQAAIPLLRLYYLRLGFLASAYVNQVGEPPVQTLPRNIAQPLCRACSLLGRPPILSYDGYALYNWRRFDPQGPIALGNIDTLQNFVHLYDEHWFILVHVEIEAIAGEILEAIDRIAKAQPVRDDAAIDAALVEIADAVWRQVEVLRRIPEKMSPALYFRTFRPYIRFFEGVVYEDASTRPMDFRGETGAQSSIVPTLVALLKIPHAKTQLTDHLAEMRRFMPPEHRAYIEWVEALPSIRDAVAAETHDELIEALATFRSVHLGWARDYIDAHVDDPRGTGGTPYMHWLQQLVDETRAHAIAH